MTATGRDFLFEGNADSGQSSRRGLHGRSSRQRAQRLDPKWTSGIYECRHWQRILVDPKSAPRPLASKIIGLAKYRPWLDASRGRAPPGASPRTLVASRGRKRHRGLARPIMLPCLGSDSEYPERHVSGSDSSLARSRGKSSRRACLLAGGRPARCCAARDVCRIGLETPVLGGSDCDPEQPRPLRRPKMNRCAPNSSAPTRWPCMASGWLRRMWWVTPDYPTSCSPDWLPTSGY